MKSETKSRIIKLIFIALILAILVLAIYLPLHLSGVLYQIDSAEELKNIILQGGMYSYLIYFIIQFAQVSFLPIPSFVTVVAGTLVFGPWITFAISFIAIMCASMFSFFIGRKFGVKIVKWAIGEQETIKWQQKLDRGKYVFFLMMLFPLFPDDILCLVVGATTNLSYKFFFFTNLITRPFAILIPCFLGTGDLIPFTGWGIPVWIVLLLMCAILIILSFKFQPQIENFIVKLSDKLSKKEKTHTSNNEA